MGTGAGRRWWACPGVGEALGREGRSHQGVHSHRPDYSGVPEESEGFLTREEPWSHARLRRVAVTLRWGVTLEGAGSGSA